MLNRWIDVSQETPETTTPILIWVGQRNPDYFGCTVGYFDGREWQDVKDNILFGVVAWQPLPAGPNGEPLISGGIVTDRNFWESIE